MDKCFFVILPKNAAFLPFICVRIDSKARSATGFLIKLPWLPLLPHKTVEHPLALTV
jgi:hypothetical protein